MTPKDRLATKHDEALNLGMQNSSWGEAFGANVSAAWDWFSPRLLWDEDQIARAEKAEYGVSKSRFWGGGNPYDPITQYDQYRAHQVKRAEVPVMDEEEWKESDFYRDNIEWEDNMTPVRARILAEQYDERRARDAVLAKQTTAQKVVGFGVQMGTGFIDPVNYIPLLGQATKLKMIGKMGSIAGRMVASGAEAAAGNILFNPAIGADLKRRGETITFEDYAVDTVLGGTVGMLFGGAGGTWAKYFRGETKDMVLRSLQKAALDIGDGRSVDVAPILKETVEQGQFNRDRAFASLVNGGLESEQAEIFLKHWDGLAAAQGMDTDTWVKKYIADVTVGGDDGDGIRFAKKVLYDDTGTPLSLKDRSSMKAYFESLEPQTIKRLKYEDPNEYVETLKKIVNHLFPHGITLKKVKGGTDLDYAYFMKQKKRQEYIHTFPETLKNEDVKLTISKKDGEKVVFLKKFFDEETQKDIYDTIVLFANETQTKFPTSGGKGKAEWARLIDKEKGWVKPEASQSTNLAGDTGNAPTRQDMHPIIDQANSDGKSLQSGVRSAVETLQARAKNAAVLKVVNTFAELPEHIKALYRQREMVGGVRGVHDGQTVYIVADAMESVEQAVSTWLHEQGVHHGLRGLVGDDAAFNTLMDSVFDHFGPDELDGIRQQYGLDFNRVAHRREAAEEMLAHIGEKIVEGGDLSELEMSAWESIKAWFAKFLRECGLDVAMTDEDVAWIVKDAVRWTMDGSPSISRHGPQRFAVDGRSNGAVEFLPDGRARVRLFNGADMDQAGEALSRILSEQFGEHPPAERLDWRTERQETETVDPIEAVEVEEILSRDAEDVQALIEAGRVTEEEVLELNGAERGVERAKRISNGFLIAAECIIKGGM
ncbi:hypothetical protein GO013_07255 [Pseudodesulfovibrio sp. JC047]|uniref:hypothetical protein n=1 Tax=Pseudodesulfovibrio sp. JC047 TaxID=2683199 RepID=UPI0013D43246|nr:hypothetical protein [Pseudodesulfovibrio sp. JC047]NDV19215.1 hypothetical protein [Pseudodesulfovibrio sp. JC047]